MKVNLINDPTVTGGIDPPGERCFNISKTDFQGPPKLGKCLEVRNGQLLTSKLVRVTTFTGDTFASRWRQVRVTLIVMFAQP